MIPSPSVVFCDAVLTVDSVLLPSEHEQHNHEHDQRALCGHVEAERELEDRHGELVQEVHEHMDDVAEEEPDEEMRQHEVGRPLPVDLVVGMWLHASSPLCAVGAGAPRLQSRIYSTREI